MLRERGTLVKTEGGGGDFGGKEFSRFPFVNLEL
jgi:hypothetical protein